MAGDAVPERSLGAGGCRVRHSPYSLMFVLMSPMMMLGNHIGAAPRQKKDFEKLDPGSSHEDLEVISSADR